MPDSTEQLVQLIAEHQNRLSAYVYSMLGDHNRTVDVLQETNLVLWRKRDEFRIGSPFLPWAFAIARMQVLAHLRDRGRERCVLDSDLVAVLAVETERQATRLDETRAALRRCLDRLPTETREIVERRYFEKRSVQELADVLGRGVSALKSVLMRARRQLAECIERRLREADA